MKKLNLKKGKYYIGDPCYVIGGNDEEREKLLQETNNFENDIQFYKGYPILIGNTADGDGIFKDNKGEVYGVDSGSIGIIPIVAIDHKFERLYCHVITFKEDFVAEIEDGLFKFGNRIIKTNIGWD